MKKPKKCRCRRKKPQVKIVKEKKFTLHRCRQCMTRKCPLCGQKVDSTKLLNRHVRREAHDNYKLLSKFCKCQSSYSSRNSVDRQIRHHSPPRFMCDSCGKQFHEKYVFEAHKIHSDKSCACTYPNCDRVYKSAAKYQRHLKKHREPLESNTCTECDKSFEEKNI